MQKLRLFTLSIYQWTRVMLGSQCVLAQRLQYEHTQPSYACLQARRFVASKLKSVFKHADRKTDTQNF